MCEYCAKILGTASLPHEPQNCSYKKSLYCGSCSQFGHKTSQCTVFYAYGGVSIKKTPPPPPRLYKPVLDVADTPYSIKSIISSYGRNPAGKKEQNYLILKEITDAIGYRLLLHPSKS
jgi:hypothetical protein